MNQIPEKSLEEITEDNIKFYPPDVDELLYQWKPHDPVKNEEIDYEIIDGIDLDLTPDIDTKSVDRQTVKSSDYNVMTSRGSNRPSSKKNVNSTLKKFGSNDSLE